MVQNLYARVDIYYNNTKIKFIIMKKFLSLAIFLFVTLSLAIAQGGILPEGIDINTVFASLSGVAAGSVFVSALLIKWFNAEKGWVKQLVSWITPLVLLITGNLLNIGFMAEFTWLMTIAYGFGTALVSNGIFDIELVKAVLAALNLENKSA